MNKSFIKVFGLLLVVGLLFAALPTGQAEAATYTTWVAQVPAAPTSADTVRVWINSDTAYGEYAGVEYKIGTTYTKVLGTYDDAGYSGANWRVDLPAQPAGTFVEYQVFTRNEGGGDYNFSGFTKSYTVLPTVVYVDDDFTSATPGWGVTHFATIQGGINAVAAGGTVNVAAGTYSESQGGWRDLTISKSLSLIGAGSDQTIVKFTNLQHGLEITPDTAGTVLVQGITFTKQDANTNSAGWAVIVGETGGTFQKITLRDVVISYASARNLHFNANTTYQEIVIEDSWVHHSDIWGACIAGPTNKLTVTNSDFTNNGKNDPLHGYGLDLESPYIQNVAVSGGHFDDNFGPGININSLTNATFDGVSASHNGNFNGDVKTYEVGVNLWDYTGSGSNNVVFKNSVFANNERGGIALGNQGTLTTGPVTVESSTITGNGMHGVLTWFTSSAATPYQGISIHHNRIINSGTTLIGNIKNGLALENNWWGCNEGFGQPGCSSGMWCGTTSCFTVPTWLVLNVTDLPVAVLPGSTQAFEANLNKNNTGTDTSPLGYLPATTLVAFNPTANVDPDSDTLTSSVAETTFTAPSAVGTSTDVCAVLDNETVCDTTLVPAPSAVYVDDSWAGFAAGADPDGAGPAAAIGYDAFATIQEGIDAVAAGGIVNVFPGAYNETASGRTLDSGGTYQFGLFFDSAKPGITLQGVKSDGSVITAVADVAASIKTNATNTFGYSGVFVEADDITITGFEFLDNYVAGAVDNNKTLEVIGDNFTYKYNVMSVTGGGSLYLNDWSYDAGTGISRVETYNISGNLFKFGASVDISSGVGASGLASGRVIANNTFTADGEDVYWASISFNGTIPSVGWFVYPVGGATITDNTFIGVDKPIRSRGIVRDDFDWGAYALGNNFEKAVMAWDIVNDEPRSYTYTSGSFTIENTILIGTVIQEEIGHAQPGDEVRVIKGTFVEDVTVDKEVTLKGMVDPFAADPTVVVDGLITITADGASVTNLKIAPGNVVGQVAAVSVYASNTSVSGNLIDGMAGDGTKTIKGIHVYHDSAPAMTNITISGNTVRNISNTGKGTDGIQIQGVVDTVAVTGNTIQNIASAGWAYGIEVTPTGAAPSTPPQNVVITGNSVNGVTAPNGAAAAFSVDRVDATHPADASEVQVHQNVFLNAPLAAVNKDPLHELDATLNYWGTSCGPAAGTVFGDIRYYPWNVDAAGTKMDTTAQTHNFTVSTGIPEINAAIACAPSNSTFNFAAGSYLGEVVVPGGGQDHLTLRLADGVVLNGSSPCVTVNADYTIISAQTIGMASCVTVAGSNGVDVADGVKNLVVDGLEIYGAGNDGIHFNGVITDVVLKDNYIHDLAGNGVFFGAQPVALSTYGIDIHGNLFQNNGGKGIEAGAFTVPAEYNSWGNVGGAAAGDGASAGVDADPFTHVDLYLVSSGTPWADQVVSGQTITYTVMGHLVNANAADFVLTYPANLTYVSSTASGSFGTDLVTHTAGTRSLHFLGYSTTGNKTGTLPLFSVTFTAGAPVADAPMLLDELTDGFGMAAAGSSSNIYAAALLDSTVTIVTLPTISSTDIQGYYLTGEQREFHVTVDNPDLGGNYAHVIFQFNVTADAGDLVLEYWTGTAWAPLPLTCASGVCSGYYGPSTGFPMANPYTATSLFRVLASVPGSYPVEIKLLDLDTDPDTVLATYTNTAYVYDKPTVTYTSDPYFIVGEAGNFAVTITNPATGKFYNNTVVFDVVLQNHLVADITAISCTDGTTTWNLLSSLVQDGANVKARIGGLDGFFTIPAPLTVTLPCTVTYATAGTYTTSASMVDVVSPLPDRIVSADIPGTATVYAKPVITPTNLGGPFDAGVPETVSLSIANASIPEPFEVVFTYPAGTVIVYDGVTYTCTTTCPPIPVELTAEPTVLDFTVTFDEAWTGDVSVSLFDSDWTPLVPDRLLASASATGVVVNGGFVLTGTFSMQGRASRAGIPVTLTWGGTLETYGPSASTIDVISNNFTLTLKYGGDYTLTTLQPRYLNVTADLGKTITGLAANRTMGPLELKGGNAFWRVSLTELDNVIDTSDAGIVGGQYGTAGSDAGFGNHGDCNFDGKVNIQDLALVGGNYDLTSAVAYTTWMP